MISRSRRNCLFMTSMILTTSSSLSLGSPLDIYVTFLMVFRGLWHHTFFSVTVNRLLNTITYQSEKETKNIIHQLTEGKGQA